LVSYFLGDVKTSFPNAFINFKGRGHSDGQLGYFMPKAPRKEGNPPLFEIVGTTEETLNSFLSKGIYSSWFKESTVVQKRSAVLNFYTPILEPVVGNVMIVGDAASFIEVYVQGAIMYGFRAAKAAAKELEGDSGFTEYVDYWKTSYEYNRPEMMEEACKLALGLQTLEDKELDYLFALQEPQIIKSYYDEFSSNLVISAIMNHVPRIKREQPLLAKKIDTLFKAPIEEVLGKGIKRYLE
jgi:flavin-dependent dehydrogenase